MQLAANNCSRNSQTLILLLEQIVCTTYVQVTAINTLGPGAATTARESCDQYDSVLIRVQEQWSQQVISIMHNVHT